MNFHIRRCLPLLAGIVLLGVLLGLRMLGSDPFERLQSATFDSYQRIAPRVRTPTPVLVVDIDDESLRRYGQWPWPRTLVADLVRNLQDFGASAIGLDIVFAEPDRTSPSQLVPQWEKQFGFHAGDPGRALPDHDEDLAKAFSRGRVVAGFALLPQDNGRTPSTLISVATIGGDPLLSIQRYQGAIPNLDGLDAAAAGHGSFTLSAGSDEVIRRLPLIMAAGNRIVPSLALETLRVALDEDTIKIRAEHDDGVLTGYTVRVGTADLRLDAGGFYWLHHPPARSTPTVPAWQVLDTAQHDRVAAEIKDAAVLVGTSAVGLADLRPTPLTPFEPGVNLHADVIEQALTGQALIRPAWAPGLEVLASVALGLAVALLVAFAPMRASALATGAVLPALAFGGLALFTRRHLLFDPSLAMIATTLTFVVAGTTRYASTEWAAQRMRTAFTHYLSPELVTALARDPSRLKLGGESREMTFLFTDLEGFTSLTETAGAEALVSLLNAYLDNLCRIAMAHGGTVDKFVGDAMHVMFSAPLDQADHAARAVRCALALDVFAQEFSQTQQQAGIPFGVTRIGVNTGRAVVGNFGGGGRFDYTAHGDAINTAARLEAANKTLGTRICVARATAEQCPDFPFRPVGTLMLKGKAMGVDVYEPLSGPEAISLSVRYLDAFARLLAGDESGATDIVGLHEENQRDPILALHARRIRAGERSVRLTA